MVGTGTSCWCRKFLYISVLLITSIAGFATFCSAELIIITMNDLKEQAIMSLSFTVEKI